MKEGVIFGVFVKFLETAVGASVSRMMWTRNFVFVRIVSCRVASCIRAYFLIVDVRCQEMLSSVSRNFLIGNVMTND